MQKPGLKVVGYARVSTDDQADRGVSKIDQPVKIVAHSARMGLDLVEVVEDLGECSKTLERPGLRRVLAMLEAGEARGVVVAKVDRLTRHVGDLVHLVERHFLAGGGAELHSATETVETRTAAGRLQLYLMGAVNQYQRELIVENTASAMTGKRGRSERTGNLRFGTKLDLADGRVSKAGRPVALVESPEDLLVAGMIRELRSDGLSYRGIAEVLNARGIPSKRGVTRRSTGRWSKSSVGEILARSPAPTAPPPPTGELT